jgi:hypothetical protein
VLGQVTAIGQQVTVLLKKNNWMGQKRFLEAEKQNVRNSTLCLD